jgi:ribonucleoside-diphosphate reductase alpha chain
VDYIFRWMGRKFLHAKPVEGLDVNPLLFPIDQKMQHEEGGGNGNGGNGGGVEAKAQPVNRLTAEHTIGRAYQSDAPACAECGSIMVRNGSCYKCINCGATSGCS